jgi:hypothetical protein
MAWRTGRPVLLLLVALVAVGCAAEPRADVAAVRLAEHTPLGSRLEIVIELTNPTGDPLPLRGTAGSIEIAHVGRYAFEDEANRTLPARHAGGRQTVVVPLAVAVQAEVLAGADYAVRGQMTYEPPTRLRTVLTESGVPLPKVEFAGQGRIHGTPGTPEP